MDFVTGLRVSTNWKGKSYDSILVIVNRFTKLVYYKLIKITIHVLALPKIIIETVVRYHSLLNLIIND